MNIAKYADIAAKTLTMYGVECACRSQEDLDASLIIMLQFIVQGLIASGSEKQAISYLETTIKHIQNHTDLGCEARIKISTIDESLH